MTQTQDPTYIATPDVEYKGETHWREVLSNTCPIDHEDWPCRAALLAVAQHYAKYANWAVGMQDGGNGPDYYSASTFEGDFQVSGLGLHYQDAADFARYILCMPPIRSEWETEEVKRRLVDKLRVLYPKVEQATTLRDNVRKHLTVLEHSCDCPWHARERDGERARLEGAQAQLDDALAQQESLRKAAVDGGANPDHIAKAMVGKQPWHKME